MRILSFFLMLCFSVACFSQISVGPSHIGRAKKFKKGVVEKFKNTETIFVLSESLDRNVYEKILKDSWDVTPYQIVSITEFDIEDYLSGNYSIAKLGGFLRTTGMSHSAYTTLFTYIDFVMYDGDRISKKLKKLSPKKREKKGMEIIEDNAINLARIYIFPKDDFIKTTFSTSMDEIFVSLYSDDVFFNYKPGFLKNYFQKVNNLIKDNEIYWLYENEYQEELKNLSSNTLYIPSYMTVKYNGWTAKDKEEDDENVEDLFKKYDFKYEIIDDEELSDKIMNTEELYYIRYVRMNSERFLQVVNSKNGEVVYRNYIAGLSYNIKPKHIADLNKDIGRAAKR